MSKYNNFCIVCGKLSYGMPQCKSCWTDSKCFEEYLNLKKIYSDEDYKSFYNYILKCAYHSKNDENKIETCNNLIGCGLFANEYNNLFEEDYDYLQIAYSDVININSNHTQEPNYFKISKNDFTDNIDYRKTYPKEIRCDDGHYVRSKAEQIIDNDLFNKHKLLHSYEEKFTLNKEEISTCKSKGLDINYFLTDFYIPQFNLYLEYFGTENKKNELKIKIYSNRKNINFAYLTYKDDNLITEKLNDILLKYKNKY